MPRITSAGIVAGVAAQVSVDTFAIAGRGTCAGWLRPGTVIANLFVAPPDTWALQTYDGVWAAVAAPASNQLAAGGGRWLAWRAGTGLYNDAISWSAAGLAGVGTDGRGAAAADGTLGVILDRQQGFPVELWRADGTTVRLPDTAAATLAIGSRDVAVWVDGGQIRAFGLPDPAPQAELAASARPIALGGTWLLLVTTNDRVWLRRWDVALGTVVVPGPFGFAADAVAIDGSTVRVCWSVTVGERPEDIQSMDVAVSSLTQPVAPPAPEPEPPDPEPEPEPPDPEPEPEPEPPEPEPPPVHEPYYRAKEYPMETEVGAIKGPGNKFGRVLAADRGKGLFGWYPIRWDRDTPDDDCWFELSKPDERHQLRHTKVDGLFGADATENSSDLTKEFYLKPGNDRGILEMPVLIYDPVSELIVGYLTWPEKGVAGPAFAWVKR